MDPVPEWALTQAGDPTAVVACFEDLPAVVWAFRGPDLVVVAANRAARASVGDRPGLVGLPVREAVPEAAGQQIFDLIGQCYADGRVVVGRERRVLVDRNSDGRLEEGFFTFTCLPSRNEHGVVTGVIAHVVEVTEQVSARRMAEQRYQAAQHVVHTLQRALLPDVLPILPGVRLAARYVVADDEQAAGGDWFDAVPVAGERDGEREGNRAGHRASGRTTGHADRPEGDRASGLVGDRTGVQAAGVQAAGVQASDRAGGRASGRPGHRADDRPGDRAGHRADDRPGDRAGERPGDQAGERPGDRSGARVVLLVGDVVGHGPTAAAAMGQLRTVALNALWSGADVEEVVAQLDAFAARLQATRAATVCVVELEVATGELRGVNRGHPPALVVSALGATRFLAGSGHDAPLGVGRPTSTLWHDRLDPDDALVLYSDGLVERSGRPLAAGLSALAEATSSAVGHPVDEAGTLPANPADRLCVAAVERMGWLGYEDDVTILVAQRLAQRQPPLHLELPAKPAALAWLRHGVSDWLAALDVDDDRTFAVQHAIGEAVTNAVEHAYADGPGEVVVEAHLSDDGFAEFAVTDRGRWRPVPESPGGRGRGLTMMRHFADRVEVEPSEGGTTARMAFRLSRATHLDHPERRSVRSADALTCDLRRGSHPVLTVRGPVDAHTAELLHTALLDASRGGGRPLAVDLTGVTHLASAGVRLLHEVAGELDAELVAAADSAAGQVLALTDLRYRTELPEQTELGEEPDPAGHPDRADEADHAGHAGRTDRTDDADRTDHADQSGRVDKADRADRTGQSDRARQSGRADRNDRSDEPDLPAHPGQPRHAARSDRGGQPDHATRPDRNDPPGHTARPDQPGTD